MGDLNIVITDFPQDYEDFLLTSLYFFGIIIFIRGLFLLYSYYESNSKKIGNSYFHILGGIVLINIEMLYSTINEDVKILEEKNVSSVPLEHSNNIFYILTYGSAILLFFLVLAFFVYQYQIRIDKDKVAKLKTQYFEKIDEKILVLEDYIIKKSSGLIDNQETDYFKDQIDHLVMIKERISKMKLVSNFEEIKI